MTPPINTSKRSFLLKVERNKLLDIFKKQFNTEQIKKFTIEDYGNSLRISRDEFYFNITPSNSPRTYIFQLYPNSMFEKGGLSDISINTLYNNFGTWLLRIKPEIETEDMWGQFFDRSYDNKQLVSEKFSTEEQYLLRQEIKELKNSLSEKEDLTDILDQINIKLDVLGEMVSVLNKVSWKDLVVGSVINLANEAFVPTENVKEIGDQLISYVSDMGTKSLNIVL